MGFFRRCCGFRMGPVRRMMAGNAFARQLGRNMANGMFGNCGGGLGRGGLLSRLFGGFGQQGCCPSAGGGFGGGNNNIINGNNNTIMNLNFVS